MRQQWVSESSVKRLVVPLLGVALVTVTACTGGGNASSTSTTVKSVASTTTTPLAPVEPDALFTVTVDEYDAAWNTFGRPLLNNEYSEIANSPAGEGWFGGPVGKDLSLYVRADSPAHPISALVAVFDKRGAEAFTTPVQGLAVASAMLLPFESQLRFLDAFRAEADDAFASVSTTPDTLAYGGYMAMTKYAVDDLLVLCFTVHEPQSAAGLRRLLEADLEPLRSSAQ